MPRPTGRGYTLLALAAGTYLAGRVVGTWELYFIAIAFLAAVVVSWILVAVTGRRIRVTRTLTPERPVDGDTPEFTYRIKNASRLPGPQLTLRSPLGDLSPLDLTLEVPGLAPRGETVLKTHINRVNRGVHFLPAMQAVADDPLGMVSSAHKVSAPPRGDGAAPDRFLGLMRALSGHRAQTRLERPTRPPCHRGVGI